MAKFVPNKAEIDGLTAPGGIVGRFMVQMAEEVEERARAKAPIRSGRLKANMDSSRRQFGPSSVDIAIGTDPQKPSGNHYRYAAVVHQGRRSVTAKNAPALRFVGTKSPWTGQLFEFESVAGTVGNPFLTDALEEVALSKHEITWRTRDFRKVSGADTAFPFHESAEPA